MSNIVIQTFPDGSSYISKTKNEQTKEEFAIAELEKLRAEIDEFMIISFFDDDEIDYIRHCFDQHISELKGEKNG